MGEKRRKKKLARQANNAGRKKVPDVVQASGTKSVQMELNPRGVYRNSCVRWTARDLDLFDDSSGEVRWDLSARESLGLLRFLEELSRKTWGECETELAGPHKRNHYHHVADLVPSARERLRRLGFEEEQIFRFRLSSTCRLWGFRTGDVFRIVWYDPDHRVYPVAKRHT